jgi:hypothetical protein
MMKTKFAILAMTGLALVAGCNRGAANNSANAANGSTTGNASASARAAAPAAGNPVTEATLVGTWGQDNCTNSMTFAADGTATSTSATIANTRWSLDGSTIVVTAPGQPDTRMPATISDQGLHLSGGGGEGASAVLARCPAPAGAASGPAGDAEAAEEASEKSE